MFSRIHSEYFFDRSLRFGLIEDNIYSKAEYALSHIEIEMYMQQAKAVKKKADLYWAAYCGLTNPTDPPAKIYHHPPRLAA